MKKVSKKIYAILLVLSLSFCLCACGSGVSKEDYEELEDRVSDLEKEVKKLSEAATPEQALGIAFPVEEYINAYENCEMPDYSDAEVTFGVLKGAEGDIVLIVRADSYVDYEIDLYCYDGQNVKMNYFGNARTQMYVDTYEGCFVSIGSGGAATEYYDVYNIKNHKLVNEYSMCADALETSDGRPEYTVDGRKISRDDALKGLQEVTEEGFFVDNGEDYFWPNEYVATEINYAANYTTSIRDAFEQAGYY